MSKKKNTNIFFIVELVTAATYGDGAQSGGSRDTYHGTVDRSRDKTVVGRDFIIKTGAGKFLELKIPHHNFDNGQKLNCKSQAKPEA